MISGTPTLPVALRYVGGYTAHFLIESTTAIEYNLPPTEEERSLSGFLPGADHPDVVSLENRWLERLGFVKGTPDIRRPYDFADPTSEKNLILPDRCRLDPAGVSYSLLDDTDQSHFDSSIIANTSYTLVLNYIEYDPTQVLGERLRFWFQSYSSKAKYPVLRIATVDLSHSINR
jgi:hypothetical protein